MIRNSQWNTLSIKKAVLKNFANFPKKKLVLEYLFNSLRPATLSLKKFWRPAALLKRDCNTGFFL